MALEERGISRGLADEFMVLRERGGSRGGTARLSLRLHRLGTATSRCSAIAWTALYVPVPRSMAIAQACSRMVAG